MLANLDLDMMPLLKHAKLVLPLIVMLVVLKLLLVASVVLDLHGLHQVV
jgi:hypothetical protein